MYKSSEETYTSQGGIKYRGTFMKLIMVVRNSFTKGLAEEAAQGIYFSSFSEWARLNQPNLLAVKLEPGVQSEVWQSWGFDAANCVHTECCYRYKYWRPV